jgi:hypothetical protein
MIATCMDCHAISTALQQPRVCHKYSAFSFTLRCPLRRRCRILLSGSQQPRRRQQQQQVEVVQQLSKEGVRGRDLAQVPLVRSRS